MKLLFTYVAFMIIGDLIAYAIGLAVEHIWPGALNLSLIVFLALYFLFLWLSWVVAVRVTAPKTVHAAAR